MADSVLSTLCGICHAEPPKYKCPRCLARTCSLACTQKHKIRADCSGVRDPTAFIPATRLRTTAGIDHDYNFISSIERACKRNEQEIVEVRKILSDKELHPQNEDKAFVKEWHGDELRHVPVGTLPPPQWKQQKMQEEGAWISGFSRQVRQRLRKLNIEAVSMPKGMTRQRENETSWNRNHQCVNWQVEWLLFNVPGIPISDQQQQQPHRILHKALENKPLNRALAETLAWYRRRLSRQAQEAETTIPDLEAEDGDADGRPTKRRKLESGFAPTKSKKITEIIASPYLSSSPQNVSTSAWSTDSPYTIQYSITGAWSQTACEGSASIPKTDDEETVDQSRLLAGWQFFLHKTWAPSATQSGQPKPNGKLLIPLSATKNLSHALRGRMIVEFPTVYVLPPGGDLPEGFGYADTKRRKERVAKAVKTETDEAAGGSEAASSSSGSSDSEADSDSEESSDEDGEVEEVSSANPNGRKKQFGSQQAAFRRDQRDQRGGGRGGGKWERGGGRGGRGSRGGRGGKNVRFKQEEAEQAEEGEVNGEVDTAALEAAVKQAASGDFDVIFGAAEDGEINSDGDEVMADADSGYRGGRGGRGGRGRGRGRGGQRGGRGGRGRGGRGGYGGGQQQQQQQQRVQVKQEDVEPSVNMDVDIPSAPSAPTYIKQEYEEKPQKPTGGLVNYGSDSE